jgi:hypothetical protein
MRNTRRSAHAKPGTTKPAHLDAAIVDPREHAIREMILRLKQRRLIAMVGAGVSVDAGYPTWNDLLGRMHSILTTLPTPPEGPKYLSQLGRMDNLWRAQEYRRLLGEAGLRSVLWDVFKPNGVDTKPITAVLARLPFRHYLMTNYDNTLESALAVSGKKTPAIDWTDSATLATVLKDLSNARGERFLVYLHGRYSTPESIVLSEADYLRRYVLNEEAPRKLSAIFMTQPVLFVGFSLTDADVMYLMRAVQGHLAAAAPQHFALLPSSSSKGYEERADANYFIKRYGITPIYYDAANGHDALRVLLEQIESALQSGRPAKIQTPSTLSTTTEVDPDDPVKGTFGGKSTVKGWTLSATVEKTDRRDLFWIEIVVTAPVNEAKRDRWVRFSLHPTFTPDWARVKLKDGWARLERTAYGAFTVGAAIEGVGVKLELDLPEVPDAPALFRAR